MMPASRMPTITPLTPGLPIKATASERPSAAAKAATSTRNTIIRTRKRRERFMAKAGKARSSARETFAIAGVGARPLRSEPPVELDAHPTHPLTSASADYISAATMELPRSAVWRDSPHSCEAEPMPSGSRSPSARRLHA